MVKSAKPGRKSSRSPRVNVTLPQPLYDLVRKSAQGNTEAISAVIGRIVRAHYAEQGADVFGVGIGIKGPKQRKMIELEKEVLDYHKNLDDAVNQLVSGSQSIANKQNLSR